MTSAETDGRRAAAVDRARVPDVSAAEGMFARFIGQAVRSGVKKGRQGFEWDVLKCWWQIGGRKRMLERWSEIGKK